MDLFVSTSSNKPGLLEYPGALQGTKYDSYLPPVEQLNECNSILAHNSLEKFNLVVIDIQFTYVSATVRTIIKRQEPGIPPSYYECGPQLLLLENRRKIKPKEIPSCFIPHLPSNLESQRHPSIIQRKIIIIVKNIIIIIIIIIITVIITNTSARPQCSVVHQSWTSAKFFWTSRNLEPLVTGLVTTH